MLLVALFGLSSYATATPRSTLPAGPGLHARLTAALKVKGVPLGRTAAYAVDLADGTVLFQHNATRPYIPASNEKLPVAWAALRVVGPTTRFTTDVVGVGSRRGPVWVGDIFLKGHGDPTVDLADIATLARTLRQRGIRSIDGRVLGDETYFDTVRSVPGWKASYVGIESPPLSALVALTGEGWPGGVSPAFLAARALRRALQADGVSVPRPVGLGVAPTEALPLARLESPPLAELLFLMNADSDNLVAELVVKHIDKASGGAGTTAGGTARVLKELRAAGLPVAGIRIVDGSGLSREDRLTARHIVEVLRGALLDPQWGATFKASLAVTGSSGTLRRRVGLPAGAVRGKTGTTNLASALSGVVRDRIVFAVIQNGEPVASWAAKEAQDRFVRVLLQEVAP